MTNNRAGKSDKTEWFGVELPLHLQGESKPVIRSVVSLNYSADNHRENGPYLKKNEFSNYWEICPDMLKHGKRHWYDFEFLVLSGEMPKNTPFSYSENVTVYMIKATSTGLNGISPKQYKLLADVWDITTEEVRAIVQALAKRHETWVDNVCGNKQRNPWVAIVIPSISEDIWHSLKQLNISIK